MINVELFVSTFLLIFVAELPDKTALATVMLAARSRALPVFLGVAVAFVIQTLVAVACGRLLGQLPPRIVHVGAGLLFFAFAFQAWKRSRYPSELPGDTPNAPTAGFWAVTWSSFLVIFFAEWGDITQLATAALVAKSADEVTIFLAAVSALWAVTLLAILVGRLLRRILDPQWLQRIAALAFFLVGIYMVTSTS